MFSALFRRLMDYRNPNSLGSIIRRRRSVYLKRVIADIHERKGSCEVLDVGGGENYWISIGLDFLVKCNVNITILNINKNFAIRKRLFNHITMDFISYEEKMPRHFDLVHSNSVIEHVGDPAAVAKFAELTRKYGDRYFVQTPNFWFPMEGHFGLPFVQLLPDRWLSWLLTRTDCGHINRCDSMEDAMEVVRGIRLLTERDMRRLFPDARIEREWLGPFVKSFIAIR